MGHRTPDRTRRRSSHNLRRTAPETAERTPDLHKIIGMRNVVVHGCTEVNSTIVWFAATQSVPALIPTLESLLAEVAPELPTTADESEPPVRAESVILP
ncbi:MAG TPA: DUF86 domain-containing protein [Actinomycetota bacterium]|nr:DUF86 domain-containing protein [Actinomycetota bacterium]